MNSSIGRGRLRMPMNGVIKLVSIGSIRIRATTSRPPWSARDLPITPVSTNYIPLNELDAGTPGGKIDTQQIHSSCYTLTYTSPCQAQG